MSRIKRYLLGLSLTLNLFVSAIAGGQPGMTISARAGFARADGSTAAACLCQTLDFFFRGPGDHCAEAMAGYYTRAAGQLNDRWVPDSSGGFMWWHPSRSMTVFVQVPIGTERVCAYDDAGGESCTAPAAGDWLVLVAWNETMPAGVRIFYGGLWQELAGIKQPIS